MITHHVSRGSDRHHSRGGSSYGSRLFHLSHIIALLFFFSQKTEKESACICYLVLIGNNGYHGYLSALSRGASGDE